eukprot:RCo022212
MQPSERLVIYKPWEQSPPSVVVARSGKGGPLCQPGAGPTTRVLVFEQAAHHRVPFIVHRLADVVLGGLVPNVPPALPGLVAEKVRHVGGGVGEVLHQHAHRKGPAPADGGPREQVSAVLPPGPKVRVPLVPGLGVLVTQDEDPLLEVHNGVLRRVVEHHAERRVVETPRRDPRDGDGGDDWPLHTVQDGLQPGVVAVPKHRHPDDVLVASQDGLELLVMNIIDIHLVLSLLRGQGLVPHEVNGHALVLGILQSFPHKLHQPMAHRIQLVLPGSALQPLQLLLRHKRGLSSGDEQGQVKAQQPKFVDVHVVAAMLHKGGVLVRVQDPLGPQHVAGPCHEGLPVRVLREVIVVAHGEGDDGVGEGLAQSSNVVPEDHWLGHTQVIQLGGGSQIIFVIWVAVGSNIPGVHQEPGGGVHALHLPEKRCLKSRWWVAPVSAKGVALVDSLILRDWQGHGTERAAAKYRSA